MSAQIFPVSSRPLLHLLDRVRTSSTVAHSRCLEGNQLESVQAASAFTNANDTTFISTLSSHAAIGQLLTKTKHIFCYNMLEESGWSSFSPPTSTTQD